MKKILFFLFATTSCWAQTTDPGFGNNGSGFIEHPISNTESKQAIFDALLQPDGTVVCIGRYSPDSPTPSINFIARYATDGTLDRSFNQKGWFSGSSVFSQVIFLQNDGKILTAGIGSVSRFLSDGTIDTSFNATGVKTISAGASNINIKAIAQQQDGKIIIVGYIPIGNNNDFAVARLNTDGSFDTTFDSDGILVLPIGAGHDEAYSVKIQSDNKILLGGQSMVGGTYDFTLARLNTDGTLDLSFGNSGFTTTSLSTSNDYGRSLDLLWNGKIVMVGSANGKFAVAKFNSNGTLDTTFGAANGKVISTENVTLSITNTPTSLHLTRPRIKVLSDNKLIISGTSDNDFKLIKYLENGSATDATFGSSGIRTLDSNTDAATYLFVRPDNSIALGGYSYDQFSNYSATRWEVSQDGGSASGTIWFPFYMGYDSSKDIKLLPDGKFLILANSPAPSIKKLNANGSTDTGFGSSGVVVLTSDDKSQAIVIQNDSKILVSGEQTLQRLNADGTTDSTFGDNGTVNILTLTNGISDFINKIHLLANGKILIAIDYFDANDTNNSIAFGLLRLNSNGTLDTSFGTGGYFSTRFNPDAALYNEYPTEIIVQSDGKIIEMGVTFNKYSSPTLYNLCAFRVDSNGVLDTTFGSNGKLDLQLNSYNYPYASQVLADDKFLVSTRVNSITKTFKFTANGQVDTTFGANGIADDAAGTANYFALTTQPDGKFIKAGSKNGQVSISRYNADGSIDTSFGNNGELPFIVYDNSKITKALLQPDNKLVLFGESYLRRIYVGDLNMTFLLRFTNLQLGTLVFENQNPSLLVYPNPIEKEAIFEYTLENSETVSIELIDLQGRIVKKMVTNENQQAGKHELHLTLDANLSPGNYFLTISTAKGKQSVQILKK